MSNKQVVVVDGDDAAPEAMIPSVALLESMDLPIDFNRPLIGQAAIDETGTGFPPAAKAAIDHSDATFFGSTSGACTAALFYLRWGRETYANVRPCRWIQGYRSPLANPEGIDFVIIRENLEDLYLGLEGELSDLAALNLTSRNARKPLADMGPGKYAVKAITEAGSERVIRHAFELARTRDKKRKVTLTCKYNMLRVSDGLFLETGKTLADEYPDIEFESYIIDDFLCRMITSPHDLDVVVMPNLYGDIMSDGAAGLMGGLGLAASGCYGDDYAYFESAHGTAPDIAGMNIINPTATLVSAGMMLDYLGFAEAAGNLTAAISQVYREGVALTPDQGGNASTTDFCHAVEENLS
ncbi:MAG: isocitrate/isopropylmalate family dehydrogenase [Pseudomonadota bacterium]